MAYVQDPNTGEWRDTDNPESGDTRGGFNPDWGGGLKGAASGGALGAQIGGVPGAIAGAVLGGLGGIFDIFGGGPSESEKLDVDLKKMNLKQLTQVLAEMARTSKGKTNVTTMLNSAPDLKQSLAYAPLQRQSGGEKSAGPSRYDYQTIDQFLSGIPASGKVGEPGQAFQFMTSNAPSPDEEARRRAMGG